MDGMRCATRASAVAGWLFGLLLLALAVLNLLLVHAVPAVAYALLSLVFFPPARHALGMRTGWRLPAAARIVLAVVVVWFTLGISDLGEMID